MSGDADRTASGSESVRGLSKSPLTLAIFGVVVGYYVCYYFGVLRHSRDVVPGKLDAAKDIA